MSIGAEVIRHERARQEREEGFDASHDDLHTNGELAQAAACYAWPAPRPVAVKKAWPWELHWWKPVPSTFYEGDEIAARIKELGKAGALIAAEIDRLIRLKADEDDDTNYAA